MRIAEIADVSRRRTEGRHRIRHDRAVATEFDALDPQFDIGAHAGGARESVGENGNGWHRRKFCGGLTFVHDANDGIHEAVEADGHW